MLKSTYFQIDHSWYITHSTKEMKLTYITLETDCSYWPVAFVSSSLDLLRSLSFSARSFLATSSWLWISLNLLIWFFTSFSWAWRRSSNSEIFALRSSSRKKMHKELWAIWLYYLYINYIIQFNPFERSDQPWFRFLSCSICCEPAVSFWVPDVNCWWGFIGVSS